MECGDDDENADLIENPGGTVKLNAIGHTVGQSTPQACDPMPSPKGNAAADIDDPFLEDAGTPHMGTRRRICLDTCIKPRVEQAKEQEEVCGERGRR